MHSWTLLARTTLEAVEKMISTFDGDRTIDRLGRCEPNLINVVILYLQGLGAQQGSPVYFRDAVTRLMPDGVAGPVLEEVVRLLYIET